MTKWKMETVEIDPRLKAIPRYITNFWNKCSGFTKFWIILVSLISLWVSFSVSFFAGFTAFVMLGFMVFIYYLIDQIVLAGQRVKKQKEQEQEQEHRWAQQLKKTQISQKKESLKKARKMNDLIKKSPSCDTFCRACDYAYNRNNPESPSCPRCGSKNVNNRDKVEK